MNLVDSIISFGEKYIGIIEGSPEHQDIIDLYNKGKYADAYTMTLADPWCCAFVVACFVANGAADIIPGYAACNQMISIFKSMGRWKNRWSTVNRGDIIFYDWEKDGSSDHVGIVVQNTFGQLTILEGNKSDSVRYRHIDASNDQIIGYGEPNYSGSDGNSYQSTKPVSQIDKQHIKTLPLLSMGSKGIYVKIIQCLLSYIANYWGGPGQEFHTMHMLDVDGDFGPQTRGTVAAYQQARSLEVDGIVGTETWTDLLIYFDFCQE